MLYSIILIYSILGFIYAPSVESFLALIYISSVCSPLILIHNHINIDTENINPFLVKILVAAAYIIGITNIVAITISAGLPPAEALSIDGATNIAIQSTINRYEVSTQSNSGNPILLALSLAIIYITKIIESGILKSFITLVPVLMYTIYTTEKWPSFLGATFLIAGILVGDSNNRKYNFLKIGIISILIVGLMLFTMVVRSSGAANTEDMLPHLGNYLFAQYNGFGKWLISSNSEREILLGKATFMGPLTGR